MDYELFEDNLKNFFETNINTYISEINSVNRDFSIPTVAKVVNGFADPQGQSVNVCLYFFTTDSPDDYIFEPLTSQTSQMTAKINVYIVMKNVKLNSERLDRAIKRYSSALDKMINENSDLAGQVDNAFISGSHMFCGADGDLNARAIRKTIQIIKQVEY